MEFSGYKTTKNQSAAHLFLALAFLAFSQNATAEGLSACADQFVDGDLANAPTMYSSAPEEPYRQNRHHCYKSDGHALFALEYWPKHHAPRWVAYKLTDKYGENGCTSRPREEMRCYFKDQAWVRVQECVEAFRERDDRKAKDPFHEDPFLVFDDVARLKTDAFVKTGHDRGHMAPNNAFSWNLCATYHTFTMANMSPQRASLNRNKWNRLEQQVLYWGVEHGPAHVVTGTVFNKFPARRFRIYNEAIMDGNEIYSKRSH